MAEELDSDENVGGFFRGVTFAAYWVFAMGRSRSISLLCGSCFFVFEWVEFGDLVIRTRVVFGV